jgi:hypothetical protein
MKQPLLAHAAAADSRSDGRRITRRRAIAAGLTLAAACSSNPIAVVSADASTLSPSRASNTRLSVDASRHRLEAQAATLADMLQVILPTSKARIHIDPALSGHRFDATITAAAGGSLFNAFANLALSRLNVDLSQQPVTLRVFVLRPTDASITSTRVSLKGPRSYFSCSTCPVEEVRQSLERNLQMPVIVEPEGLATTRVEGVVLEWTDLSSLNTALRSVALTLTDDVRSIDIWTIQMVPSAIQ